ncbi:MAG: tyrosine-type recombinase/integrase [Gemmatimonadota bacterium]|nr:MAG: tyrosine-type recombinase/integrase [Gemmatimonadota bacterium]
MSNKRAEYGRGSIRQRGSRWQIRYYADTVDENGRRIRTRVTESFNAKSAARKQLNAVQGAIAEGRHHVTADRLRYDDLEQMMFDHYDRMPSYDRVKRALTTHLRAFFGFYKAKNITAAAIKEYVKHRRSEGAADGVIRYELALLRQGLRLAVEDEKLSRCPPFPSLEVDNARKGFFEPSEFEALKANIAEHHRGWLEFAYLTGWRVKSEVLTRQWQHVDFQAGTIRLEPGETKNGKGRTFPFDVLPELGAVLEAQRAYTDKWERVNGQVIPWVFHSKGKPLRDVRRVWRTASTRAGLMVPKTDAEGKVLVGKDGKPLSVPARIPHDFRRTAVRRLERAGVSRSVAKQLVGHASDAIYERYAITSESDLREGLEKVARLREADGAKILPMRTGR